MADALSIELVDGPNADKEISLDAYAQVVIHPAAHVGAIYTATPLSFDAYTAIHRPMGKDELDRLGEEQHRPTADRGRYVLDVLPAEYGFSRGRRPR